MTLYAELGIEDRDTLESRLCKDAKRERKIAERTLTDFGVAEEQLTLAKALVGVNAATGVATDARYALFPFCWDRTYSVLQQTLLADPRAKFAFQQFRVDERNLYDRRPDDLVAHKRALEPQLKRSFNGYIAKFAAVGTDAGIARVVNVIGLSLSADAQSGTQPKRRISKTRPILEPCISMNSGSDSRHLAFCAAEFWASRSAPKKADLSHEQVIRCWCTGPCCAQTAFVSASGQVRS